ncbi:MAG: hypothetical protein HYR56_32860 [Acidobacteria bacterium]|nr:hypothetical protein [Acidobacteriota bacterium]MBI3425673.1 hypothetical protein [Acidobacteriota bacterium]
MSATHPIHPHAVSVLDLLIAQCTDLEALLALARQEEQAATARNFDEVLRVVNERATLGERLEVYHRQIAALRDTLGKAETDLASTPAPAGLTQTALAGQTAALVAAIRATDARTQPLLLAARHDLRAEQCQLDKTQRGVNAYLRNGHNAVACDQHV